MKHVYIGDIHADIDKMFRLFYENKIILNEGDKIFSLGDFGIPFLGKDKNNINITDRNRLELLKEEFKNIEIFITPGNHENYNIINSLDKITKYDSELSVLSDNIYFIPKGSLLKIDEIFYLSIGGALSIDKEYRTEGYDWWPDEIPNYNDCNRIGESNEKSSGVVDTILTHTAPESIIKNIIGENGNIIYDSTTNILEKVNKMFVFKEWYFGHFHKDIKYKNFTCLYNDVHIREI